MQEVLDIEDWVRDQDTVQIPEAKEYRIRLWDGDGFDEKRSLADQQPTARQILETFERFPADEYVLLYLPCTGMLETVDLNETINLRERGPERFFAFKTDRLLNFMVNGRRFAWGATSISVKIAKFVARIPDDEMLFLELSDSPDMELGTDDVIQLGGNGLERLTSRKQS